MARVVAQGNGSSVRCSNPAVGAQDEDFAAAELARIPAHTYILREAEQVARRLQAQHIGGDRQSSFRARLMGHHFVQLGIASLDQIFE